MNRPVDSAGAATPVLADAFAAFTAAAGKLEFSYQQLQCEVACLREELEERNAALTVSLSENENMRLALGRILEAMPCGVVVLEGDDKVSFANPETQRLLGAAIEKASAEKTDLTETAAALLRRLRPYADSEQELCVNVEGQKRWLVVRAARLDTSANGKTPPTCGGQTVLIIRDVTMQREMESEREEARRLIALAEMSSVLAHEIRNPLGSMELFAGLLSDSGNLTDEQRAWASHLRAGVRSLSATVNNVLRGYTIGKSAQVRLLLAAVLRNGIDFVAPLAEQAAVEVVFENELGDSEITGNCSELQQVTINLALNAFQHTHAGGRLLVRAMRRIAQSGPAAVIEFADTGCGIRAEHLENIFEAGFSANGRSPGLGLAVCRRIVQQHGGSIGVESTLGQGTTFHMEFPLL